MSDEKINITFQDNSNSNETKENSIDFSSVDKIELLRMYINNIVSLKDIVNEFSKRNLDLWKEYKIHFPDL